MNRRVLLLVLLACVAVLSWSVLAVQAASSDAAGEAASALTPLAVPSEPALRSHADRLRARTHSTDSAAALPKRKKQHKPAPKSPKKHKKPAARKPKKPHKPHKKPHKPTKQPPKTPATPQTPAVPAVVSLPQPTVCTDIPPPSSQFSCAQQKAFQDANPADNKCDQGWMQGYCLMSCGKCGASATTCTEQAPDSNSCQQQAGWGKCGCPWMRSGSTVYCQCTCGPQAGTSALGCADAAPATPSSSSSITLTPAQVVGSPSLAVLRIQSDAATNPKQPSSVYQISDAGYPDRKAQVQLSLKNAGLGPAVVLMFFAIGMQETEAFSGYDASKSGSSENFSFFNLNRDLIESVTYAGYNCAALNDLANLDTTSDILARALTRYGVNGLLNFIRGGRTGLDAWNAGQNDCAFDCLGYRQAIASYVALFDANPALLSDSRRVAMDTKHQ